MCDGGGARRGFEIFRAERQLGYGKARSQTHTDTDGLVLLGQSAAVLGPDCLGPSNRCVQLDIACVMTHSLCSRWAF